MSWRFQRRKKILPGLTVNVGKRGAGVSVGRRGARVGASRRGLTASLALVGTGLAFLWRSGKRR